VGKKRDLSTENLAYLTSKQALADLAAFRNFIHTKYNLTDSNKWIAFGGSYAGALAAWLRLKYPELIYAAVASSAPVHATVDFSDYHRIVGNDIKAYSAECFNEILAATLNLERYLSMKSYTWGSFLIDKLFKYIIIISLFFKWTLKSFIL
jgi:pimeloyl-ACP methyl ester carboxylesterase